MNITNDNYEAYLLDYLEGRLSPDETAQLKAYVAAQGLDWDELTEPLPQLEALQTSYEGKAALKKQRAVVPLYAKIASAAAAAGLLLTLGLWPDKSMPKAEPIAELQPIKANRIEMLTETPTLPKRTVAFVAPKTEAKQKPEGKAKTATLIQERKEMPVLANLQPIAAQPVAIQIQEQEMLPPTFTMDFDWAMASAEYADYGTYDDEPLSLLSRGLLWLTGGRHDSLGSLVGAGVNKAKQEVVEIANKIEQRTDESLAEVKERWDEKWIE